MPITGQLEMSFVSGKVECNIMAMDNITNGNSVDGKEFGHKGRALSLDTTEELLDTILESGNWS